MEEQVASALRRPVSLREIEASSGTLQHGDVKFQVPAAGLTFAPAAGDTVTDDESDWDVLDTFAFYYGIATGDYSYGAAAGLFKSVISLLLLWGANKLAHAFGGDGLYRR